MGQGLVSLGMRLGMIYCCCGKLCVLCFDWFLCHAMNHWWKPTRYLTEKVACPNLVWPDHFRQHWNHLLNATCVSFWHETKDYSTGSEKAKSLSVACKTVLKPQFWLPIQSGYLCTSMRVLSTGGVGGRSPAQNSANWNVKISKLAVSLDCWDSADNADLWLLHEEMTI